MTDLPIKIFTDHKGLMYFAEAKELTRRQARYLDLLSEFNIKIIYRTGATNLKADALTRLPGSKPEDPSDERVRHQFRTILTPDRIQKVGEIEELKEADQLESPMVELDGVDVLAIEDPIYYRIAEANKTDNSCSEIRKAITEGEEKFKGIALSKCKIHKDILYHKDKIWVPEELITEVIREVHDQPACGHPGGRRTYQLLKREFYWRGMKDSAIQYVHNCYACTRAKAPRNAPNGLLQPLPVPEKRWQHLTCDFITGLPWSDGFNAIWVVLCRLTKERHYVACVSGDKGTSAEATAIMLVRDVFRLHGLPESILSDRGPQFIATVWKAFCKRLSITAKLSTAYHPQTDGLTERNNQSLETHLRLYYSYMQDDWAKWLLIAEFADNNATAAATGVPPFFANKGFYPRMSFSPDESTYTSTRQRLDAAKAAQLTTRMEEILQFIRQNMEDTREVMAKTANRHRTDTAFQEGDQVFLSTKDVATSRPCDKLSEKRIGPFKVLEQVGTSYRLDLPSTMRQHNVFHPDRLTKAGGDPLPGQRNSEPNPVVTPDGDEWVVSDILDSKRVRGRLKYRV